MNIGKRFGKLVVLEKTEKRIHENIIWLCQCDCGNTAEVITKNLNQGYTRSCGCLKYERNSLPFISRKSRVSINKINDKLNVSATIYDRRFAFCTCDTEEEALICKKEVEYFLKTRILKRYHNDRFFKINNQLKLIEHKLGILPPPLC